MKRNKKLRKFYWHIKNQKLNKIVVFKKRDNNNNNNNNKLA